MSRAVKKEWKQLLSVFIAYTIWNVAVGFYLLAYQGADATVVQFGSVGRIYTEIGHSIIKGTLVYYFMIFEVCIPIINTGKWRKILPKTLLFFIVLTGYEYIWDFKVWDKTLPARNEQSFGAFLGIAFVLDMLIVFISFVFANMIVTNEVRKRKEELEKEKLKAELSAIKYQINPHFLFNSLSFIYTKTVKQSPEAAHAVHLLSEIMSYALGEGNEDGEVPLRLEVEHMKKVIEMNQIRFSHTLNIEYQEEIEDYNVYLPTLVLVTLVENAFKHGELGDENNKVNIILKATPDSIYFFVHNKKRRGPKEPSKGIGLSNVQQRLQLTYGNNQSFIIKEDENYYSNEIIINL